MLNNDVLRSLRYTLDLTDADFLALLQLKQPDLTLEQLQNYLANEDQGKFVTCDNQTLLNALDSLILQRRGPSPQSAPDTMFSNNLILKKLRVAFKLQENDLLDILNSVEFTLSKHELSALFRKEGHPNYRVCGDQLLRNLLVGLARHFRN